MVFAIPDWEDGNAKKQTNVFSVKTKENLKNRSTKKSPQKKTIPKKATKENGVAEKSKLISKENKKQLKKQKLQINNKVVNITSKGKTKDIHKNGLTNKNPGTGKVNIKMVKKQNKEKLNSKSNKKDKNEGSIRVETLDTDKLDEVLLNAKKKKFNEALKKDDVEALLFQEDKIAAKSQPARKLKQKNQNKTNVKSESKNSYTDKKQNKSLAKNVRNMPITDKEVFKVKPADKSKKKITPMVQTLKDKKKEKLKQMLKEHTNRSPIVFNRNKLRERMLDRLKSAQFRFLNEKLYTSSGSEASQLFQSDPAAFHNYHEGYKQQLKKWPVNPLDVIASRIKKMPKTHVIADMGCGEAALAKRVPHSVRSFDLVAAAPDVEVCDMAHSPLLAASVDAVVYCLALMGTELTKYLLEANRVLKMGGILLIAEVESRFSDVNAFTKDVSRLGFKLQKLDNEREVFFFMEFVKNQEPPVKKSKLPVLTLKPCIYKRR